MWKIRMATSSASAATRPQANNRCMSFASETSAKIVHSGEHYIAQIELAG